MRSVNQKLLCHPLSKVYSSLAQPYVIHSARADDIDLGTIKSGEGGGMPQKGRNMCASDTIGSSVVSCFIIMKFRKGKSHKNGHFGCCLIGIGIGSLHAVTLGGLGARVAKL